MCLPSRPVCWRSLLYNWAPKRFLRYLRLPILLLENPQCSKLVSVFLDQGWDDILTLVSRLASALSTNNAVGTSVFTCSTRIHNFQSRSMLAINSLL